jgi:hypothetical protein
MPQTLRLTQGELAQIIDDFFEAGIPAISFLELSRSDAKDYETIIDLQGKYVAETRGPSLENDPLKQKECYAVVVRKPTKP